MTKAIVIGSGPAAAGAVLALSRSDDVDITVIDVGVRLESERQHFVDELAASGPGDWDPELVASISEQPVGSKRRGVPEKRTFGSDYPFRNFGQLDGVSAAGDANASLISAAYGGFSTVWGSQLMPFSASTFDSWPVSAAAMRPHYEAVVNEIPFVGEEDDLAELFPLMRRPAALPELSPRSRRVLDAYHRHRAELNRRGITVGKARLALDASRCVRCGLCMTGCPYGLIYSAAQTFDVLERRGRVTHHAGLLAVDVSEVPSGARVVAKELTTGRLHCFEADRVYIACGAIGTTRLVASSLRLFDADLSMVESQQFVLPLLSVHPIPDPRREPDFTLNQFNMVIAPDGSSDDLSQLHFYAFNSAFVDALPPLLRSRYTEGLQTALLRRLTVALGYLPSWRSPRLVVRVRPPSNGNDVAEVRVERGDVPAGRNRMLRQVLRMLLGSARRLDLYPVLPMLRLAAAGRSYHWGGSFPHGAGGRGIAASDALGRVGPWQRVHLVDAAVFPNVPAMTFTLTIMANAHRIATQSLELAS